MPDKVLELLEEFRAVMGKVGLLDTILPPVLFLLLNGLAGFKAAMIGALGLSVVIAVLRLHRGQSLLYALAGLGSVGLAIAFARRSLRSPDGASTRARWQPKPKPTSCWTSRSNWWIWTAT